MQTQYPTGRAEVTVMDAVFRPYAVRAPRGGVRLYTRPHIDLLRVAAALCCS